MAARIMGQELRQAIFGRKKVLEDFTRCVVYTGLTYGVFKYNYDILDMAFFRGLKSTENKRRAAAQRNEKSGEPSA